MFYGETENAAYLALRCRATWMQCDAFHETARAVLEQGRALVVDLSGYEYLDSTFLGTVHELVARGNVAVTGVTPAVRALFEELSMDQVLAAIRDDVSPAPPDRSGAAHGELRRRRADGGRGSCRLSAHV